MPLRKRGYALNESDARQYQVKLRADADLEDRSEALMEKMNAAINGAVRRVLVANGINTGDVGKVDRYMDTIKGGFMDKLLDVLLKLRIPNRVG